MKKPGINFQTSISVDLEPKEAYGILIDELAAALNRKGILFEAKENGRVVQGTFEVGRVVSFEPGKHINLEWHQTFWEPEELSEIALRFEPVDGGTQITMVYNGSERLFNNSSDITGWFASEIAANILETATPGAFGDWISDRRARRPSGIQARNYYRDPLYHYPGFRVILRELDLKPDDYFLELGCGGGALLKSVLQSGCMAAAVDHSIDMVNLAREENSEAIRAERLKIFVSDAGDLPFPDEVFSCAAMIGVLGFLSDPVKVFSEINRVLKKGGRIVVQGADPEMRGTPAAPEPIASRLHFYESDELELLARKAGFQRVSVARFAVNHYAKEAGIPEDQLPLFAGPGPRFLIAYKD